MLVGNASDAAGLEITLGQFTAEFTQSGWIALTGAGCDARLDEQRLWTGWCYPVKAGQQLKLSVPHRGMRSYLAISGGIVVPEMLGSRSTDLKASFGGHQGRLIKEGDRLPLVNLPGYPVSLSVLNSYYSVTVSAPYRGRNTTSSMRLRGMLLARSLATQSAK